MSSASATRPRACSTEVLKNSVPARATATKASPTPPAAVSSMRLDRPGTPGAGSSAHAVHEAPGPARGGRAGPARALRGGVHRSTGPPGPLAGAGVSHGSSILPPRARTTHWPTRSAQDCHSEPARSPRCRSGSCRAGPAGARCLPVRMRCLEQVRIGDDRAEPLRRWVAATTVATRAATRTLATTRSEGIIT